MLTPEDVQEFRRLVKQECGIEFSYEEAYRHARQFIDLYRMLMGPIPEDPQARSMPLGGGGPAQREILQHLLHCRVRSISLPKIIHRISEIRIPYALDGAQ